MAVITISGELGSGSAEVARRVATRLGYALADKDTTEAIFRLYGLTRFEDLYGSAPSVLDLLNADNLLIVAMANEIAEAVARRGKVVILGRAGFAVLGAYADVLNVHIQAPAIERARRVLAGEGLADLPAAEARVSEDDEMHRKYVQRFYNRQWGDPSGYQLVLDTGSRSGEAAAQAIVEGAAQAIVEAARALDQQTVAKGVATTAQIQVDPVLADAVARVMA